MEFFRGKQEEQKSPIDQILSSFTKNAKEMNSIAGFPGVLLLIAVLALGLPVLLGAEASLSLSIVAGAAIVASSVTYTVQWWYMAKQSEAQALILRNITEEFLRRYLDSKDKFEPEYIDWAISNIINKLTHKPIAPNKSMQPTADASAD